MSFELTARLIGGIGLLLLGMRLMTDGLRIAAGQALREIPTRSTRTRLRGVASGLLVTALVQSSSAVTVATIGFVDAGLLTPAQAVAVRAQPTCGRDPWLESLVGRQRISSLRDIADCRLRGSDASNSASPHDVRLAGDEGPVS